MSMPVHFIKAHPEVKEDSGKIALQRGPLVYCLEWPDQKLRRQNVENESTASIEADLSKMMVDTSSSLRIIPFKGLLPGTLAIEGDAVTNSIGLENGVDKVKFIAIPYFEWANRGPGRMRVWMPVAPR